MPVFVSVTVKHNSRTLIRSQIVEIENNKTFKDLFELAVESAKNSFSWSAEEQSLLADTTTLIPTATLSNPHSESAGAYDCVRQCIDTQ